MKVFGDVDKTKEGVIRSEYPSWYFDQHQEELEESIRQKEMAIDSDLIPKSEVPIIRERLDQERKRLDEIKASRPELSGVEKDNVVKAVTDIGGKIKSSMFTRSEMEKGLADAHVEAQRLSTPVIEIKSEAEAELVKACGIKIRDNGKITGDEARKVWKIGSKLVGGPSNVETLRKG
jgi:hypothetical protein